jgi:hypothetical protein
MGDAGAAARRLEALNAVFPHGIGREVDVAEDSGAIEFRVLPPDLVEFGHLQRIMRMPAPDAPRDLLVRNDGADVLVRVFWAPDKALDAARAANDQAKLERQSWTYGHVVIQSRHARCWNERVDLVAVHLRKSVPSEAGKLSAWHAGNTACVKCPMRMGAVLSFRDVAAVKNVTEGLTVSLGTTAAPDLVAQRTMAIFVQLRTAILRRFVEVGQKRAREVADEEEEEEEVADAAEGDAPRKRAHQA